MATSQGRRVLARTKRRGARWRRNRRCQELTVVWSPRSSTGLDGNEIIDRKLNPVFTEKGVEQARRQAAVAAYDGFQAVWKLPTADAVEAAGRFMSYAKVSTILVRQAG
jgi:hypothetical protein